MDNNNKKITIISSVLEDVFALQDHLRQDDINEVTAHGHTPLKALLNCFIYSDECYTVKEGSKIIAIYGASTYKMPKGFVSIWCLGAEELKDHPVTFVKTGIKFTRELLKKYDLIMNYVDARNIKHIEWLKRIGMNLSSSIYINGYEFIQFYKIKGV